MSKFQPSWKLWYPDTIRNAKVNLNRDLRPATHQSRSPSRSISRKVVTAASVSLIPPNRPAERHLKATAVRLSSATGELIRIQEEVNLTIMLLKLRREVQWFPFHFSLLGPILSSGALTDLRYSRLNF